MYRLGVDLGGTKFSLGLLDENAGVVCRREAKLAGNKEPAAVLGAIRRELAGALAESGISAGRIISCGVGVPGTIRGDGETVAKAPNLGWENVPAGRMFTELTGVRCRLIQDSRAAAYGEYAAGNGRGKRIVVCVTLGTGLGTGIVMNGEVFAGALGNAGEMGHIPAVPDGRPCGCGKRGCLEKYAAGLGLDITAEELYGPGHTAADIFDGAGRGDERALAGLDEAVRMLGQAMVALVNLISPDCLLFSGGMSAREKLFVRPLIEYIKTRCYSASGDDTPYMALAALGPDAPMVGAALYAAKFIGEQTYGR